jgi:hypothetical protein
MTILKYIFLAIILLFVNVIAHSQVIVGGAGVCLTNADPNTIVSIQNPSDNQTCRLVVNITTGEFYTYNNTSWVSSSTGNIYTTNGTLSGDRTVFTNDKTLTINGKANITFGDVSTNGNGTTLTIDDDNQRIITTKDLETGTGGKGIILVSPNGTRFRLTISNAGILETTQL